MITKTRKIAAITGLSAALLFAFGCTSTDTGNNFPDSGGVTLPDTGGSGTSDLGLLPDVGVTADTAVTLPPGKPTTGFGDVCDNTKPCKTGTTCIGIQGWKKGFCTIACNGSSDTRCQDSLPGTLDKTKILAGCVLTTASGSAPTSCAFICEVTSGGTTTKRSCPTGMECTHSTTGGKLCKPK